MTSKFFINMSHISDSKIGESFVLETYGLIASSNTSHLEAHVGFIDPYVL